MTSNEQKILQDAVKILADLGMALASGGSTSPVLIADVPTAKDALERILLELQPIDAPALSPTDRAADDAAAQADEDAKFPPTTGG